MPDNFSTGRRANLAHVVDKIDLVEVDIRDAATVQRSMEGMDLQRCHLFSSRFKIR